MSSRAWLDDFIDSYLAAAGSMDFNTLRPFSWLQMHPLYALEWCGRLSELVNGFERERIGAQDFADLHFGTGVWRDQLAYILWDLKSAGIPKKERLRIVEPFNTAILASTYADSYGFTSNIQHSKNDVSRMLSDIPWQSGGPEHARLMGKLYVGALHLVHGLYGDIYTGYSADNFGEYDASKKYGKGHTLVIRHFADLRPTDIWPQAQAIPCKSIDIYTIYRNVSFRCDAISCHSIFTGNVVEGLVDYAVCVDGTFVDSIPVLTALKDDLASHAMRQWQQLMGLAFEKVKQKGLEQRSYVFKQLFALAGLDWRPTKEMKNAVKGKPFADEAYWGVPRTHQTDFWRKIMDPRVKAYPKAVRE